MLVKMLSASQALSLFHFHKMRLMVGVYMFEYWDGFRINIWNTTRHQSETIPESHWFRFVFWALGALLTRTQSHHRSRIVQYHLYPPTAPTRGIRETGRRQCGQHWYHIGIIIIRRHIHNGTAMIMYSIDRLSLLIIYTNNDGVVFFFRYTQPLVRYRQCLITERTKS